MIAVTRMVPRPSWAVSQVEPQPEAVRATIVGDRPDSRARPRSSADRAAAF